MTKLHKSLRYDVSGLIERNLYQSLRTTSFFEVSKEIWYNVHDQFDNETANQTYGFISTLISERIHE
jgi:plasmid maintenance system antidote protein VapI